MSDTAATRPNLIAGKPSSEGPDRLSGHSATGSPMEGWSYAVATEAEIARAGNAAAKAFHDLASRGPEARAKLLDRIADLLDQQAGELAEIAHRETSLPMPRLTGEVGRTSGQLRMFAGLIREGSWVDARIDLGNPLRTPLPKPDLRRLLVPIGPVAVFGASNFPFAFSVAGGDTASALAAGCPVIAKAHPAHPETSQRVGELIREAIRELHFPAGTFSMVHGGPEVGRRLVELEQIRAVAFTGSQKAGRALYSLAAARPTPIPVFAEMGSVNPVFVLPGRVRQSGAAVAAGYAASLTLGVGQFCTNPGLLIGIGPEFDQLVAAVAEKLRSVAPGVMLTREIRSRYIDGCDAVMSAVMAEPILTPDGSQSGASPGLYRISGKQAIESREKLEEVFGPVGLAIVCQDAEELLAVASKLDGQLTATIQADEADQTLRRKLVPILAGIAGRVVYNGFPTGVEVGPAMQHGGPFPATTDSRHTSVGTAAIFRFVRPVAFQDLPDVELPQELQDDNPLGIARLINGQSTREPFRRLLPQITQL